MAGARRTAAAPAERLPDRVAMGVLLSLFPIPLLDDVIRESGRADLRRRALPARLVLYYVLALCLFPDRNYEQVMRLLLDGLSWRSHWLRSWEGTPSASALSRARERLGADPLRLLFERLAPAPPRRPGPRFGGLHVLSLDGIALDVAGSRGNAALGYPAPAARFPQVRVAALADAGTHALLAATLGAAAVAEEVLAARLLRTPRPGTLLAMPFAAAPPAALRAAAGRGHGLLLGAPAGTRPPPGLRVRALPAARGVLFTTLLDPQRAPAEALAACYAERWRIAPALSWLRAVPAGGAVALRSRDPETVVQEVWATLCLYQAMNALTCQAGERRWCACRPAPGAR
ncbi:transposase domain-containing protein [Actinomadura parmotrematis]|uniref:Transposase domain-containing protein n=1 Tax=Actinomadura parmotrematis TaxID=2864039 RepID=A0ABS7FMT2_9ACTN|nr:transposase domain-containing protein [Actinomadura parmotrematis]MBW8481686.1 transposase domain-containing protein [Actinomadura parmotrematis]